MILLIIAVFVAFAVIGASRSAPSGRDIDEFEFYDAIEEDEEW